MERTKFQWIEVAIFAGVIFILSRNKLWNDEINLWADCVSKSPHKSRPYVNLGFAYINAGVYDKSLEVAQKAIRIDPKNAGAYYNLSIALQKMGDLNKAIAMGKKSLEIDPKLHMAHYTLAGIYFEKGEYEEAAEAFKRFLGVFPYFPNAHHLLAVVYASQKQFDKAIGEFELEIRINPSHALAHLNSGQIYWYEFQNRQKAIYHLKAALMLDPLLPRRGEIGRLVRLLEGLP
jgi:tetratricopeptide (TPR) repeat protein